ncbi:MAG: hypothetical protein K0R39_93 [Symbiobacteriaceae bacterium]|jgi:hypothetical protein|nr:hypothetical protein [Symbiobacteriaceae bacterium]
MSALILAVLTVLGLVAGIVGLVFMGDDGFMAGMLGLITAFICGIISPTLWFSGRKQMAEMAALFAGQDLLVHWSFDPDEWHRYTENEYTRGMKQTRTVSIWSFAVPFLLVMGAQIFGGGFSGLMTGIAFAFGAGGAVLFGGTAYLMTKSADAANRAGVGEVFIGATCLYYGRRFHTWAGKYAALEKVAFEPGDPSVVQFNIKYGTDGNSSHVDVRVPVPRGQEAEAQQLVASYYAAS